eukprot:6491385-Lingulodinium_polyedra.AAC.1
MGGSPVSFHSLSTAHIQWKRNCQARIWQILENPNFPDFPDFPPKHRKFTATTEKWDPDLLAQIQIFQIRACA